MFVALELFDSKAKGLLGFVVNLLSRPQASMEAAEAYGARYAVLRAPAVDGQPDWPAIAELAGHYANRMLLPDELLLPTDCAVQSVRCPRFERRVLLTTACELVKRTRMPMYRRVLGLVDPDGAYTDSLYGLLQHYTAVHVVTAQLKKYRHAAEDMMEQLGAPVIVGDQPTLLSDCVLVLIPERGLPGLEQHPLPCPVLAGPGVTAPAGCELISNLQPAVSPELVHMAPAGVAPHRFAAALYDYCGVEHGSYTASRLLLNYRSSDLGEAVRALLACSDALSPR